MMDEIESVYGIPLPRLFELLRLFEQEGYFLNRHEDEWKALKRKYFKKQ